MNNLGQLSWERLAHRMDYVKKANKYKRKEDAKKTTLKTLINSPHILPFLFPANGWRKNRKWWRRNLTENWSSTPSLWRRLTNASAKKRTMTTNTCPVPCWPRHRSNVRYVWAARCALIFPFNQTNQTSIAEIRPKKCLIGITRPVKYGQPVGKKSPKKIGCFL